MLRVIRFPEFEVIEKVKPLGIESHFDEINMYIDTIDSKVLSKIEKDINYVKSEIENEHCYDYFHIDILEYYDLYGVRSITYDSLCISLYRFIEIRLLELCKLLEKREDIKLKDIKIKGINKYKKFLQEVHQVDFNEVSKEWSMIDAFRQLRNYLVHSPDVSLNENKLSDRTKIKIISQIPNIKIHSDNGIINFEINDISTIKSFFKIIVRFIEHIYYKKA